MNSQKYVFTVLLVCLTALLWSLDLFFGVSEFGKKDSIAFWAGVQNIVNGENPYDPERILEVQQLENSSQTSPQVFLNPPWSIPIFIPFFSSTFIVSTLIWKFSTVLFLLLSVVSFRDIFLNSKCSFGVLSLLAILHQPIFHLLHVGQNSFLLLFCCLFTFKNFYSRPLLAGIACSVLSIKPQGVFLLGLLLILESFKRRNYVFLVSGLLGFLFLNGAVLVLRPEIFYNWRSIELNPLNYVNSSLPSVLKLFLQNVTGEIYGWPSFILPGGAILLVTLLFLKGKLKLDNNGFLLTLLLSSLFCPYIFFYEYTLLLPLSLYLFSRISRIDLEFSEKRFDVYLLIVLNIAGVFITSLNPSLLTGIWVPLLLGLTWLGMWYSNRLSPRSALS